MKKYFQFSRHGTIPEVELMSGKRVLHHYPRHFHDTLSIAVIHGGIERCWNRGCDREYRAGDIALFNPGEVHDGRPGSDSGWTYDILHFPPKIVDELLGISNSWFDNVVIRNIEAYKLAQKAIIYSRLNSGLSDELIISLLKLTVFKKNLNEPDFKQAKIVRDYLDANIGGTVRIASLGSLTGLSPEHVIRSFSKRYGITPHSYHNARKIEMAKSYIRSMKPLVDIAYDLEFCDQSHFNRWFTKITGVSPNSYRKAFT